MSTFWIRALQLILSLSFLVVIHELGHFTFARIFKVRVEKFYMFFNPQISLLRMKKINGKWQFRFFAPNVPEAAVDTGQTDKKGKPILRPMTEEELAALPEDDWRHYPDNTEWGIGWLPFGGYCAISGMVDETHKEEDLAAKPQPWEFRSKNVWQRFCIIIGGVLVNFIAALIIFSAVFYTWGEDYLPLSSAKYGMQYADYMLDEGLQQGDQILTIGSRVPETQKDVLNWLLIDGEKQITVLRNGETIPLTLSDELEKRFLQTKQAPCDFRFPFVINELVAGGAAAKALMMKGDSIVAVNDMPTPCYYDVTAELAKYPCDSVSLTYFRASAEENPITSRLFIGDECKIGVYPVTPDNYLEVKHIDYGFWEAIPVGIKHGWETLANYVKQFKLVFTKEGAKSVGGFGAIGSLFPAYWDWQLFWTMTAFLSIILAFMNIIPIPGLDGGYVFMLIFEMITRKKPSDKFLEVANNIGFWFLMALLILANGNDILRWLGFM